ncbi:MAG: 2-C-methyl-D-erythritol 4-phosphate cytidylyltransferase [Verrucomicrobia bacterium]|nr:2-C-methyl-D-erythritol 4-phosphate cytidylyltransferase [Verrucomicrobiota bacterium]
MSTSAIIVAAGTSRRMGFDKLTALLAKQPVLVRTVERFASCPDIDEIVLVAHSERIESFRSMLEDAGVRKVARIVSGGAERHLSVWAGVQAADQKASLIAVHDGARPLIRPESISQVVRRAAICGAVALAAPVVETLKRADADQRVVGSVDRVGLWSMQTPQVFRRDWLVAAYEQVLARGESVTDEVSAVQAAGFSVELLTNGGWNTKITYPEDLDLAHVLYQLQEFRQT